MNILRKFFKYFFWYMVVLFTLVGCFGVFAEKSEDSLDGTKFIMNTVITIKLHAGGSEDIIKAMFDKLDELDQLMSLEYMTSDVSQINKKAGLEMVTVSNETLEVIKKSISYSELSEGYFDISFGPLIEVWDINAEQTIVPNSQEVSHALSLISYRDIKIQGNLVGLNDENMSIDLGGIAKGYAADIIADMAVKEGVTSGIVNIGGNILVIGSKTNSKSGKFSIGIQNPFALRNGYLGIINVENATVVTSGNYERYFEVNGRRYHHILDKDTGYPVDNGVTAVSVVAERSIDADALSTVIYILGIEEGMELIESLQNTECLFITNDNEIVLSSGMKDLFTLTDQKFSVVE